MLGELYMSAGTSGTILFATLVIITTLTWFQVLAGVVISGMPSVFKGLSILVLSLVPPVAIPASVVFMLLTPRPASVPVSSTTTCSFTPTEKNLVPAMSRLKPVATYAEVD